MSAGTPWLGILTGSREPPGPGRTASHSKYQNVAPRPVQPMKTWVLAKHQHPSPSLLSPPPKILGTVAFPSHCSWAPGNK